MLELIPLVLVVSSVSGNMVINEIVDKVLEGVSPIIRSQNVDVLHVEDVKHEWKYKWHFVFLKGEVDCTDGNVKDLSTLHRTGDAVLSSAGNRITVSFSLGLQELILKYKCRAKARHLFSFSQDIKVTVNKNSVKGQVSFVKEGNQCTANLDNLKVDYIDGVHIHSGGGEFHKIEDKVLHSIVNHLHGSVLNMVSKQLRSTAQEHLGPQDWCQHLPQLARNQENLTGYD